MNSLVVQQHHQNVQICSQNLMLKKILATAVVNFPLQIKDVPVISYLKNIPTSSTSDMPHPPTFKHLHRNLLPKKDGKNELVPYKKDLMSLITSVISSRQSGRPKLIQNFFFVLKNMPFLCTMNLSLNRDLLLKRKKNNI